MNIAPILTGVVMATVFLAIGLYVMEDMDGELNKVCQTISGDYEMKMMLNGVGDYGCYCVNGTHYERTRCLTALSAMS
jgi:hypothetical protein